MSVTLRFSTQRDLDDLNRVYLSAFSEEEREQVAALAQELSDTKIYRRNFCIVAEHNASLVGHIVFSPVTFDTCTSCLGYILAPLAVHSDFHGEGIGSKLVEYGLQQLKAVAADIVFVYGDPKYYSRFGFHADIAATFIPPHKLQYPFGWQALLLGDNQVTAGNISCVEALNRAEFW